MAYRMYIVNQLQSKLWHMKEVLYSSKMKTHIYSALMCCWHALMLDLYLIVILLVHIDDVFSSLFYPLSLSIVKLCGSQIIFTRQAG